MDTGTSSVFGTLDAAHLALQAEVKRLIISHAFASINPPGSKERAIADIGRGYAGEIIFADELMVCKLQRLRYFR